MFRASSAHLQEDTVVHMQHMVLSLSMRVLGGLSVHSVKATRNPQREGQYHMLPVYNCILLQMST